MNSGPLNMPDPGVVIPVTPLHSPPASRRWHNTECKVNEVNVKYCGILASSGVNIWSFFAPNLAVQRLKAPTPI